MDIKKFNSKMARPKFSKGGYIKKIADRKYFDVGGIASNITPSSKVGGPGNLTNTNNSGIGGLSTALGLNAASANIQPGTNTEQLNNAYTGANNAINAQIGLANTVNPQVGQAVNNQNTVAQEELGMTRGEGPNPALNQLAQTTGTNVSNQAALMAGQRGAGANPALIARQAALAGSNVQQQAAGEAATLEAQQQIAAQKALADLSNQQVGQAQGATTALNTAQQNEQNILQGANTASNNAAVGMQSNINNINAQNNKQVLGALGSGISAVSGLFSEGGEVTHHGKHKLDFIHKMAKMGLEHFDKGGAPMAQPSPAPTTHSWFGAPQASASSDVPPIDQQKAKEVSDSFKSAFADGGQIRENPLVSAITTPPQAMEAPQMGYMPVQNMGGPNIEGSDLGGDLDLGKNISEGYKSGQTFKKSHPLIGASNAISGGSKSAGEALPADLPVAYKGGSIWDIHPSQQAAYSAKHFQQYFSKGGEAKEVKAMVSPGERYWNPEEVEQIKHGADPMKLGVIVPGKAKVPGKDSIKNDTVPVTLQEGGVVNPLHLEKTKDSNKARLFVLKSLKATGRHMKRPGGMS